MDELIDKAFGPYVVVEKINEGGMAVVYKGYQESLNRYVAIKVLRGELAQDREFIARFRREALAVARLSHPNILHVYDAGLAHGVYYIVMDYVEGGSLKDLIKKEGPLDVERAVSIAMQLAEALDCAHQQGLVHRDVKPSNVLMTRTGRPLLTDFGIARVVHESTRLTRTGTSIGTPEYMSPEQAQGKPTDARTDIYALGIVLYEMLSGQVPFTAETPMAVLYKQVGSAPAPLREVIPGIPAWLENVVDRALAKDPVQRFQTAAEVVAALQQKAPARKSRRKSKTPVPSTRTADRSEGNRPTTASRIAVKVGKGTLKVTRGLAGFLLRVLAVLLVVALLLSAIAAVGSAYALSALAERAVPTYRPQLAGFSAYGQLFTISKDELREAIGWGIEPYALDMINNLTLDLQAPQQVELSADVSNVHLRLQGRLVLQDNMPQIYLEKVNDVPLYFLGGVVSGGINQGLDELLAGASMELDTLAIDPAGLQVRVAGKAPPAEAQGPPPTPRPSPTAPPTEPLLGHLKIVNELGEDLTLEMAGQEWPLDALGTLELDLPAGSYAYVATVDGAGHSPIRGNILVGAGNTIYRFTAEEAAPTATKSLPAAQATKRAPTRTPQAPIPTPPRTPYCTSRSAQITEPPMDVPVSGIVVVKGTAQLANLDYYKIELGVGSNPSTWAVLGELRHSAVVKGVLGQWDTSTYPPGTYVLRLVVVDTTGNYKTCQTRVQVTR
jgi:tRNA A-37 threonylcarbamoyl transferase component Bud32